MRYFGKLIQEVMTLHLKPSKLDPVLYRVDPYRFAFIERCFKLPSGV